MGREWDRCQAGLHGAGLRTRPPAGGGGEQAQEGALRRRGLRRRGLRRTLLGHGSPGNYTRLPRLGKRDHRGIAGAVLANAMFELLVVTWSTTVRAGGAQLVSESVATFGLRGVVIAVSRTRAAIISLFLIHATCRTHPAHPVPSAAAPAPETSCSSMECNPVLGPSTRSRIGNKSTIDDRVSTP